VCDDKIFVQGLKKSQYETIRNQDKEYEYENKRISMVGPSNLIAYAYHVSYTLTCKPQDNENLMNSIIIKEFVEFYFIFEVYVEGALPSLRFLSHKWMVPYLVGSSK